MDEEIRKHNRDTIEWLRQFKFTELLRDLVARHKFSAEELEFLRAHWTLLPKKDRKKGTAIKWG